MNKLIQTLVLTAVVFSPLSLIASISGARAHHTAAHVSTVALEGTKTTKAKMKKKGKKSMTTSSSKKKPAATDATMTKPDTSMPAGTDSQMKPTKPDTGVPSSKVKPNGAVMDGSMAKPASTLKVPTSGTSLPSTPTSIPSGVSTPTGIPSDMSKPSVPSLPTGLPK
jgi:hypothetical protein